MMLPYCTADRLRISPKKRLDVSKRLARAITRQIQRYSRGHKAWNCPVPFRLCVRFARRASAFAAPYRPFTNRSFAMKFRSWLNRWHFASPNRRARRAHPGEPRRKMLSRQLSIENLEDRSVPAFLGPVNYDAGTSPYSIVSADFNNYNILDIAVANSSSSNVTVRLGIGDGTFKAAQTSPTGSYPLSVAVGDFDNDGKLDLATANAYDVSVLKGNGDGTFQAPASIGMPYSPRSIAVGDFNNDGLLDLGVTSNYYIPGSWGYYGWYPGYYYGQANVLIGSGDSSFSGPYVTWLNYGYHEGAAVADFNGDGRDDFAAPGFESTGVDVSLAAPDGTLGSPSYIYIGAYYPDSVAAGDVNGDGKADLVTANLYSESIGVVLGNGDGSFGSAQNFNAGTYPQSVALADFNGDGKIDVAVTNSDAGTASVMLGGGDGSFRPPLNSLAGTGPTALTAGDFNGDTHPDLAVANYSSNNASVLINDNVWPALDAPSLSIDDVSIVEGNVGTTNAAFTVTLSAASTSTVKVHYSTFDGSAVAGSDYEATSGTVTFDPGETSKTILVPVIGDRTFEYSESFGVRLTDPVNAFVADSTGAGTIQDDEPYISIGGYSHPEGNSGTPGFNFHVQLSNAYDAPVKVDFATADFTADEEYWYGTGAKAGVDYQANSGTITFDPGQTSATITVLVNGDRDGEDTESFWVNLSNPDSAQLSNSRAMGTIEND